MDKIFAPWRGRFVLSKIKYKGCIFCIKQKEKQDKKNYVVYRGKMCFIILNIYPYNPSHLMIAPYRHIGNFEDLQDNEMLEIMQLTKSSIKILKKEISPDGFNLGYNLGKVAGAGISEHIHLHIVPRFLGDTNFLPIIGETKIISISLDETYKRLRKYF